MTSKKASFISLASSDQDGKKIKLKEKLSSSDKRGIVYMSRLPHGFFEKQLRQYLCQFGSITNLRLGRSKRSGGSKGYAFVEFRYPEVAKIVCETMNNYLMFDKLVKCELVADEKTSRKMFRQKINPSQPPLKKARFLAKKQVNQLRTEKQNNHRLKRQLKRLEVLKQKLEDAGIPTEIDISVSKTSKLFKRGTPKMEIDVEDRDIKLKTPPNVKKVKSRSNSAAATPKSELNTPRTRGDRNKTQRELALAAAVVEKLQEKATPKRKSKSAVSPLVSPKKAIKSELGKNKKTKNVETAKSAQKVAKEKKIPKVSPETPKTNSLKTLKSLRSSKK